MAWTAKASTELAARAVRVVKRTMEETILGYELWRVVVKWSLLLRWKVIAVGEERAVAFE